MTNTYRVKSDYAKAIFTRDVFEGSFTAAEERDYIEGGHLTIVARPYKVLSDNYAEGEQGSIVELALPVEVEAAQMFGGHIERVDKPAKTAAKATKVKD